MNAENFVINNCGQRKVVEDLSAVAPDVDRTVLAKAFIIEAINLGNLTGLVVTANQRDSLRVADLQGKKEQEGLNRVVATIDEVSHEEIVGIGALATDLEQLHQVVELTVNITTDLNTKKGGEKQNIVFTYSHGGLDVLNIRLLNENLFGTLAERFNFALLDVLALLQLLDPLVEVMLIALLRHFNFS